MKALILAAGLGTRLRPLTDNTPKSLVPILDKPLLWYHLESLSKYQVNEIIINTHHLHEQVEAFVKSYTSSHPNLKITTVYEDQLLGSAGTIAANRDFFSEKENFLVIYGDNLTNINYQKLVNAHDSFENSLLTLACYVEHQPQQKGIVEFDINNRVQKFLEKPQILPQGKHWANGGIYVMSAKVFEFLESIKIFPYDMGHNLLPSLLINKQNLFVYKMDEFLLDIGTSESYNKAQGLVKKLIF